MEAAARPRRGRGGLRWREPASEATLRRDGRRWTVWTAWVVVALHGAGAALVALEPLRRRSR